MSIIINTTYKKILADTFTPVGVYLKLRDVFRDAVLLESTDYRAAENSYSFIALNAIAGIEIGKTTAEYKLPLQETVVLESEPNKALTLLQQFMQNFVCTNTCNITAFAQGLYGYTTYDAVQFFDSVTITAKNTHPNFLQELPLLRYRLYQYVLAFNHFKNEMYFIENHIKGVESNAAKIFNEIYRNDVPQFSFKMVNEEKSTTSNEDYMSMVSKAIQHCKRGDVFQVVISKQFQQNFTGDDFNVYRALRTVNPSPYLFYFDYGNYKLMGSSPESQLKITNNTVQIQAIAGTYKRTGNEQEDMQLATQLLQDVKENAEHVMLVDLARNDVSRVANNVTVSSFKQVKYYSHVIHLVSEVTGKLKEGIHPFFVLPKTFPAGTLSGAPKIKAIEIINELEPTQRNFYGGCLGFVGFNGNFNHAIIIRSLLSKNNTLFYQAGAGVVALSNPATELEEVNNKVNAIRKAINLATTINE
jgi:anthranilate synthase component 1